MAGEEITPNVVLTADNSGYDQSMQASAGYTSALASGVDTLGQSINKITKTAGKSMMGIAAGDVALITGATAAWASYEKQISKLQAQAAVVSRSRREEGVILKSYTESVRNLRKEYGTSTSEAAQLTQTIAKMTGNRQRKDVKELADTFTEMSNATGEGSNGLATSLLNLNKVMGTSMDPKQVGAYADQMTTLAASSNTSAAGLAEFASQIAPVGRLINLTQTEVTGVSKAFISAGQDGYQAATAFNQIVSGIAKATASGSPDLKIYANLLGTTVEQFKQMSGREQIVGIFDKLSQLGPKASVELNRLGLDGVRTMRAITAVTQQTGGLGSAIGEAQAAYGNGATERGSEAAMRGMVDELAKLRAELSMTAENLATKFGPAVTTGFQGLEMGASAINELTAGPLGELIQMLMAGVAPVAAFGGAMALMATGIFKLAAGFTMLRNSGSKGLLEGFQGGGRITREIGAGGVFTGNYIGADGKKLGGTGRQVADSGTWIGRGLYNTGQGIGAGVHSAMYGFGGFANETRNMYREARGLPPAEPRSAGQMVARSTRWVNQNMILPQLDQMRFQDYSKRMQVANRYAPGFDPAPLFQAQDVTNSARQNLAHASTRAEAIRNDPMSTAAERKKAHADVKSADAAVESAKVIEASARARAEADNIASMKIQAAAQKRVATDTTVAAQAGVLAKGLLAATAGAAKFAAQTTAAAAVAGGTAFARSRGGKIAMVGGGLAVAGSGLMEDTGFGNATSMAMMGSMAGPWGAVGGAVIGTGMDVASRNDKISEIADTYAAQVEEGAGLRERIETLRDAEKNYKEFSEKNSFGGFMTDWEKKDLIPGVGQFTKASRTLGVAKNFVEGIGPWDSDNDEARAERDKIRRDMETERRALKELARATNTSLSGTEDNQLAQLDAMLQNLEPTMSELGITLSGLKHAYAMSSNPAMAGVTVNPFGAESSKSFDDLIKSITRPGEATGLWDRIEKQSDLAFSFINSPAVQKAIESPDDANAQFTAITGEFADAIANGMSPRQIIREMGNIRAEAGTASAPEYQLAAGVQDLARRQQDLQMPTMSTTDQFAAQASNLVSASKIKSGDEAEMQNMLSEMEKFSQGAEAMRQKYTQLLYQQREFKWQTERAQEDFDTSRSRMDYQYNLQRSRAQDDFQTQRKYQEHDYQLGRRRAEADFALQRNRGQADYDRSMRRSRQDYNLSRLRQEEDYHHQVMLMQEQAAQQLYNVYERVQVKGTSSAEFLLVNADDQLQRMQQQSQNLDQLRGMGLSDDAIQNLGLTDAGNEQQLARFVSEAEADPRLIRKFNRMVQKRIAAAAALVSDESSTEWQEFQRNYRLSRERAGADFEKQVVRSHRDFNRQMKQMENDFGRSMNRQAQDYETAQQRQQEQFSLSMKRAAHDYGISVDNMTEDFGKSMKRARQDMDRSAREITGTLQEILQKSTQKLDGTAQRQAEKVLKTFQGLSGKLGPEANEIMVMMSEIFGFKFDRVHPNRVNNNATAAPDRQIPLPGGQGHVGMHEGGVLPGRSVGRDNMHFFSKDHGRLSLAGGEAVMVPEWVDAIGGPSEVKRQNADARAGRFTRQQELAEGGVVNASKNPDARVYVDGEPMSAIAAAQLKLAEKLGHTDMRVMQGSWQPYTSYSGKSHMGPGVMDTGPGT